MRLEGPGRSSSQARQDGARQDFIDAALGIRIQIRWVWHTTSLDLQSQFAGSIQTRNTAGLNWFSESGITMNN